MTYRQALETALRECGCNEAEVARVLEKAERYQPIDAPPLGDLIDIRDSGTDRAVIEVFKGFWFESAKEATAILNRLNSKN